MNLLYEKTKEVAQTLLPVVLLVLLLCFTVIDVETDVILRFIVGGLLLLFGLSIFLWGVDLSMNPIGEYMSREVATSKSIYKIAFLSFILGFLITVAEPDLLILGSQIEDASGGSLGATPIVYIVSMGVGIMISLGIFRLLRKKPLNVFMTITYAIIFILAIFVSEEFFAISFDASGATTGALTTPFVLAISLGMSRVTGGKQSEENSFGLVGIMSAGPILAIMLLSILTGQKNIQGEIPEFVAAEGVFAPIFNAIPHIFVESLLALLPIVVLFLFYNFVKFKIKKSDLSGIIYGLTLTLLGLVLFLTGVNSGFMDMGRIIGMELAKTNNWLLIIVAFGIGLIVVLVEPAVHVLGEQIEEVTGGHIPIKLIRMTLSLGVAIAIALSMVRILVPDVKLWYFIVPGFILAIILSYRVEPVFVGIAFDAGGVASGPMTATFVLAFAQGAADVVESANVLVDGFGVIAMVAMAPVLSIMILGTAFKHKRVEYPDSSIIEEQTNLTPSLVQEHAILHNCIMVVVNRGYADKVVDVARQSGAAGATIIHGRGTGEYGKLMIPIINFELQPEKEIIMLITGNHVSDQVADKLMNDTMLHQDGDVVVFSSPTEAIIKNVHDKKSTDLIGSDA